MLRIGELARRAGVSADVLRAWERRYGLLEPERTAGGFRLYGEDDLRRVLRMRAHLDAGVSAAEAARLALSDDGAPARTGASPDELLHALLAYDEAGAQSELDRLLAGFSLETALREAILPAMRQVGDLWVEGRVTVAQEHFASNLVAGRLLGLARGWGRGEGPRAILACPPGEQHVLGLIAFGLALREHGWRVTYLGANTPAKTLAETVERIRPALAVLAVTAPEHAAAVAGDLASVPLALGGPGADAALAERLGATLLDPDPVEAAAQVAQAR